MTVLTPPSPLRILQISDSHLFEQRNARLLNVDTDACFRGVIDYILENENKADVVLATGDIAQDGSSAAYERFLQLAQPLAPIIRGLPGNHDSNDAFYKVWESHADAVTDVGDWRLILLDSSIPRSSAGHIAPDQMDLLHKALSTAEGRHILVAVHHNPVPIGSLWLDGMMIDNGHELLTMLNRFPGVRGLIWGHVHQEFDTVYNFGTIPSSASSDHKAGNDEGNKNTTDLSQQGSPYPLRLLAAPATCVQFAPRSSTFSLDGIDPGYRWLELHDDGRIETGIVRVPDLGIRPDMNSAGY